GRQVFERVVRYQRLFTDAGRFSLEIPWEGPFWLYWEREGPLTLGYRLIDESVVAATVRHVRELSGRAVVPDAVSLRHAAPPRPLPGQASFFGRAPSFQSARVGCAFDRSLLDAAPRSANASMSRYFVQRGEERLASLAPTTIAARVREIVARELPSGEP